MPTPARPLPFPTTRVRADRRNLEQAGRLLERVCELLPDARLGKEDFVHSDVPLGERERLREAATCAHEARRLVMGELLP